MSRATIDVHNVFHGIKFTGLKFTGPPPRQISSHGAVMYEHLRIVPTYPETLGEKIVFD